MGRALPDATFAALPFGTDAWRLVATGDAVRATPVPAIFALGNGFVGVRGPGEPADAPRVYLNGVFEKMPIAYHESAHGFAHESDTRLAVADATRPIISVDGVVLDQPQRVELDMRQGVSIRTFAAAGHMVTVKQLVAMRRSGTVATQVEISAGTTPCRIEIRPVVTPPPAAEQAADPDAPHDPRVGPAFAASPWETAIDRHGEGRADRLRCSGFAVAAVVAGGGDTLLAPGQTGRFDCFAAYAARRGPGAAQEAFAGAAAEVDAARSAGFDAIATEQSDWFAAYWEDALVSFPETPAAEQALRHALFELVQAVGRDGATSIGAKGQTGEGYEGHVFWDADSYVLPALVFLRPEIARAMLIWRISRLDAARANARTMGQERGALYPWRTIEGSECSAYFPAGSAQYHINADIAHALRLYVETTGDRSILDQGGAAMLAETARIWLEIGYHDPARGGAFVINRVTGPDEYSALVDNNLYTNMMAAEHMRFAVAEASALLTADEAARMTRAATEMLRPFDAARQIPAQDDAFFNKQPWPFAETPANRYPLLLHFHPLTIYRHQVAKQADAVLATVLLRDQFDPAVRRRMLDAYEAVTVHDSTLSASAFAAAAAGVGDAARATRYWRVSLLTDLLDLFGNSGHGLHMAALAGSWTALAMGFAGMRTTEGRLSFAPIAMPEIGGYAFRLCYHGRRIEVRFDGTETRYRLVSGAPLTLFHHGAAVALDAGGEALAA